jgi:hypothetical protein
MGRDNNYQGRTSNIETKRTMQKINETNCWFFRKINKIHEPLEKLTERERKKTQNNKIGDEKMDITTNTNEIQRIIREYFENL